MSDTIRVLMPSGDVKLMELEQYLRGVVPSEMPPDHFGTEALKVQAVASRSYARFCMRYPKFAAQGADVDTTTNSQVWRDISDPRTDAAIQATSGEVLTYNGQPINAFYSAVCGGRTRKPSDVWPVGEVPYLQSVDCPCDRPRRGHGVGMCQVGSELLQREGRRYQWVLDHYYTDVTLQVWREGGPRYEIANWWSSHSSSRDGKQPRFIIIHDTESPDGVGVEATRDYLQRNDRGVSTHEFVAPGRVWRMVQDERAAHHVGSPNTQLPGIGRGGANPITWGIESYRVVSEPRMAEESYTIMLDRVSRAMDRLKIPLENVLTHRDVNPSLRQDPLGISIEQIWADLLTRREGVNWAEARRERAQLYVEQLSAAVGGSDAARDQLATMIENEPDRAALSALLWQRALPALDPPT